MSVFAYAVVLLLSALVSSCLAAYAWSERRSHGSAELARLALAVAFWALCAAVEGVSTTLAGKLLWAGLAYSGSAMVPPLCLLFVWSYVGQRPSRGTDLCLFAVPVLTAIFAATSTHHHLIYSQVSLVDTWAGMQGRFEHGPWYYVHTAYSYTLLSLSLVWLWWSTRYAGEIRTVQARWITVAFLVPFAGNLLYVLAPGSASGIDLTPIAFTISGTALAITIYRHRLMRLGPLARSVLFEQMEDAVVFLDAELLIVDFNSTAGSMLGLARESLGRTVDEVRDIGGTLGTLSRASGDADTEIKLDDQRWLRLRCSRLDDGRGRSFGRLLVIQDVTRYRRAEEQRLEIDRQLQHTQKLESLGVLAGGIAHDFNNLLTVILGRADLALAWSPHGSTTHDAVADIITASRRAADLCRQMLAYSGRGMFVVGELDLNELVHEMASLIQTSISKKARLTLDLGPNLPHIRGDATQLRQVVLNLITNASEALAEQPGTIDVISRTELVSQAELCELALGAQLLEGHYVTLEVRDSGNGMTPEVLDRMFEPFFTTKFTGRGLGLSAVLGIVRGHQGALAVDSKPGAGTRFRVLLPALPAVKPAASKRIPATTFAGALARHTVLLVDDEEMVREVGTAMLERLGHEVLVASNGQEALRIYHESAAEISCVILDLTMPGPDSDDVLRAMRAANARVPVIVSSGFTEPEAAARLTESARFLQKPYELSQLRSALEAVLHDTSSEQDVRAR